MLLFLPNLQAGQVGILELKVVFLLEILCHGAFHSLPTLQLQGKPVWRKGRKYVTQRPPPPLCRSNQRRHQALLPPPFHSWESKCHEASLEKPRVGYTSSTSVNCIRLICILKPEQNRYQRQESNTAWHHKRGCKLMISLQLTQGS